MNLLRSTVLLAVTLSFTGALYSQDGFLDGLRKALQSSDDSPSDEQAERNQENLKKLLSGIRQGFLEASRALPEDTQEAMRERRKAWMDAIASGFADLKGEDIESWLENSDNVILNSLSRDPDAPGVNAINGVDRLPKQWWFDQDNRSLALLLLEIPKPILRREDLPGPPVWFVNGITTTRADAIEMGDKLAEKLGRRVHVLHNPTFLEPPNSTGLDVPGYGKDDLSECLYDRLWPATVVNRLDRIKDEGGLESLLQEKDWLQGNPTTRQLTYALLMAKGPFDLVTHSQGCLIARNAFFSLAMLNRRAHCEHQIAWIAAGIPLNDHEISPRPHQTKILNVGDDPVAKIVGLRGGTREYKGADHSFLEHYLQQIEPSQLWQQPVENPVRARL